MKASIIINIIIAVIIVGSIGYWQISQQRKVNACVGRGIEYFSSIGSWPMLRDGRDAEQVARDRCWRTTTAF